MTIPQLSQKLKKLQESVIETRHQLFLLHKQEAIRIVKIVEDSYGLPRGSVYRKTNKREIAESRQMSLTLINYITGMGKNKIAPLFNLTPSSISNAKKVMRNFFETNSVIRNRFIEVCHELKLTNEDIDKIMLTKNKES